MSDGFLYNAYICIFSGCAHARRYCVCIYDHVDALPNISGVQLGGGGKIYGPLVSHVLSNNGLHQQCNQPNFIQCHVREIQACL